MKWLNDEGITLMAILALIGIVLWAFALWVFAGRPEVLLVLCAIVLTGTVCSRVASWWGEMK